MSYLVELGFILAPVAQQTEQLTSNQQVVGAIPTRGIRDMIELDYTLYDAPFAVQYEVYRDSGHGRIVIDRVRQEGGSYKWAIRDDTRRCLSTEGKWTSESMPSNRPEDWIATHRFGDFQEAWRSAKAAASTMLGEYEDRVRMINEKELQSRE